MRHELVANTRTRPSSVEATDTPTETAPASPSQLATEIASAATLSLDDEATGMPAVTEWPMFHLNRQNTGSPPGTQDVVETPQLRWKSNTGDVVESSLAVVDGVFYQGTFNKALFALETSTGQVPWRFPVGGLLRVSPSVVDGLVYFGADDNKLMD